MTPAKNLRTCKKGHQYYKSSDCPTCPVCEEEHKPKEGFLAEISAPARRALEKEGITSLKQLSKKTVADVLKFHGMGPASIPRLQAALKKEGLTFKK
ncbi:MAG: RNA polymerase alpha subunit C-terminal domain-containing protein [Bacteroidota bacterium]